MNPKTSRAVAFLLLAFVLSNARAAPGNSAPNPTLRPLHRSYAFDQPRILAQQRLFGLAHGIELLATACDGEPGYREALMPAFGEWRERQAATINTGMRDLARYYFGEHAAAATRRDIAKALNLGDKLGLKPGSKELRAACDTFAEALRKPRYDLRQQYSLWSLASRLSTATATESRVAACRARLSDDENTRLAAAEALWHQTFDAGIVEAKNILARHWEDSRLDGTLEELTARASEAGKRNATAERCRDIPQWLLTRKSDPDADFQREQ